jgi:1-acyl-sn-glycerol-3-phosphate acyltransferase
MNKYLARFILRLIGWKVESVLPPTVKKAIVVMAPHTSNWDFVLGWLGFSALGLRSKYLVKEEAFFFPLGIIIKWLGAIPVNREKNSVILQAGELFNHSDKLLLTLTPEGTRSLNKTWKKGFYLIARHAKVPMVLGYLDYKTKYGGMGLIMEPSDDYQKDLKIIEDFYKGKVAKFPEKFNLSPQNLKNRED